MQPYYGATYINIFNIYGSFVDTTRLLLSFIVIVLTFNFQTSMIVIPTLASMEAHAWMVSMVILVLAHQIGLARSVK